MPDVVIAGVNGKMGGVLAAGLAASGLAASGLAAGGATLAGIDRQPSARRAYAGEYRQADLLRPEQAAGCRDLFARADWCLLCLPEDTCAEFVPSLLDMVSPGTLIVDTLSVKTALSRVYDRHRSLIASKGLELVGINPLFSPELGFADRPTLVVQRSAGAATASFLRVLSGWGTRTVVLDEAEHDKRVALVQGLTHATIIAFGLTLHQLEYQWAEYSEMVTPPHATLLSLLARTVTLNPEVYWDIQRGNPHAARARQALLSSVAALDRLVTEADLSEFTAALASSAATLQPGLPGLAAQCADLFTTLGRIPEPLG